MHEWHFRISWDSRDETNRWIESDNLLFDVPPVMSNRYKDGSFWGNAVDSMEVSPEPLLLKNAHIATMVQTQQQPYGLIEGDILIDNGKIAQIFSQQDQSPAKIRAVDLKGAWVLPGLIDAHTHLIFAGNRAEEFDRRLKGESYESIARSGGGILSTVKATRAASEEDLFRLAEQRLSCWIAEGVTCIEIKSGYGLDKDAELKMLRVARALAKQYPIKIHTTFLGAHAVPAEFKGQTERYLDLVLNEMLPAAVDEYLVDSVDVFCEGIGFSLEQTERVFKVATALGLPIRAHVEQLSDLKGARLAAEYGALSVDHLEYLSNEDVEALSKGVVANLLPLAFYHLSETQLPPIGALRQWNIPMAIASDFNPGSAPLASLLLAANMGARLFKLTPEEVLRGMTLNAAKALARTDIGTIAEGKSADLSIWNLSHPADIVYSYGLPRLIYRCFEGELSPMSGHQFWAS